MRPLVIGVGNRWRGDDGVGPRALDALAASVRDDVDLLGLDGEPTRMMAAWAGRPLVVVIDAVCAGTRPGTIHRVDALALAADGHLGDASSPSTHGAGVAAAVALGRVLDNLPDRLVVLGIEPAQVDHGDELSAPVAAAFDALVRQVGFEVTTACA